MKDITIKTSRIKKELTVWAILIGISYAGNIYSIFVYETAWNELFSSLHYVFLVSLVLYAALGIVRLLLFGTIGVFHRFHK